MRERVSNTLCSMYERYDEQHRWRTWWWLPVINRVFYKLHLHFCPDYEKPSKGD